MSNRVCLFSTNFVPGADVEERRVVGISEWGNDLPIGFKILVSANPKKCPSLIFDGPDSSAVIADYEKGVARFLEFLARIPHPAVPALAEEASTFLWAANNKNRYFLLEPEEYFWLGNEEPATQMEHLLGELANLDALMENAIAAAKARMHEEANPPGVFARLLGARTPVRRDTSNDMVFALGLGGWDGNLFYQPE
jgi:hypothetical protein